MDSGTSSGPEPATVTKARSSGSPCTRQVKNRDVDDACIGPRRPQKAARLGDHGVAAGHVQAFVIFVQTSYSRRPSHDVANAAGVLPAYTFRLSPASWVSSPPSATATPASPRS